jgi:hypothetical protein
MMGYFNSKHMKVTNKELDNYFTKVDLNGDGKINFEEYDIFVRTVYENEYVPALEREIKRRRLDREGLSPKTPKGYSFTPSKRK